MYTCLNVDCLNFCSISRLQNVLHFRYISLAELIGFPKMFVLSAFTSQHRAMFQTYQGTSCSFLVSPTKRFSQLRKNFYDRFTRNASAIHHSAKIRFIRKKFSPRDGSESGTADLSVKEGLDKFRVVYPDRNDRLPSLPPSLPLVKADEK